MTTMLPSLPQAAAASARTNAGPGANDDSVLPLWQRSPLVASMLVSGASVAPAAALTTPFDVVKVRGQLQAIHCSPSSQYGPVGLARKIITTEGYGVLWKGTSTAAVGGLFYGGIRIGLYQPIREQLAGLPVGDTGQRVTAALISGSLAATAFNPIELVKTRMQSKVNRIQSPLGVVRAVVEAEGLAGLWKGTGPSAIRAAVLTASQCATYDMVKAKVMAATGWEDKFEAQLATSMVTGIVTTTATSPVDMIKSRIFVGGGVSGDPLKVAAEVLRNEGPSAFFSGWQAQYLRLGPQTVITFMLLEQLRFLIGMDTF